MQFQLGDVVQLKSSGPLMTVTYASGSSVTCTWFNREGGTFEVKWADFPVAALQAARA
ncbi:YodC family protein [Phenylobacterium sp.]|uniref:YodC family protein n=1 Tax=Phenylobacterium sp. TaxID=1871053 RepID=UPI0035C6D9BD